MRTPSSPLASRAGVVVTDVPNPLDATFGPEAVFVHAPPVANTRSAPGVSRTRSAAAIDAGAEDVALDGDVWDIVTAPSDVRSTS